MRSALPPRLRHRLADTILAALQDGGVRRQLVRLGADEGHARRWCTPDTTYGPLVRERAQQATEALRGVALRGPRDLDETLEVARVLFDVGLFFEVHEVLEPYWREARGDAREALRGLIQIAVGYQHWAHGNLRGARALLQAGSARVRSLRLRDVALKSFAATVARSIKRIERATPGAPPVPPRLGFPLGRGCAGASRAAERSPNT